MEQHQSADTRFSSDGCGVANRRVAPGGLHREFGIVVLRIVDQEVGTSTELDDRRRHLEGAVERLLVIGDVDHRGVGVVDAVSVGGADVFDRGHRDRGGSQSQRAGTHLDEVDLARQDRQVDREEWWPDERGDLGLEVGTGLGRADQSQPGVRTKQGNEERDPLNVVPMEVGDQRRAGEFAHTAGADQFVAEVAQTGAEIEHDRVITFGPADQHTRRVPADAVRGIARARRRAANAIEGDIEHLRNRPPIRRSERATARSR